MTQAPPKTKPTVGFTVDGQETITRDEWRWINEMNNRGLLNAEQGTWFAEINARGLIPKPDFWDIAPRIKQMNVDQASDIDVEVFAETWASIKNQNVQEFFGPKANLRTELKKIQNLFDFDRNRGV